SVNVDYFTFGIYYSKFSNIRILVSIFVVFHTCCLCSSVQDCQTYRILRHLISKVTFYNITISHLSGIIYVLDIIQRIDHKNDIVLLACFLCAFEFAYVDMVIVYLLRFSKNDVPVMHVLVHVHIKYQIQHSLGIILLHTDHTCMQYSSHVNSGTKI
ncbi:hypothetical protein Tsp_14189, partial [Trichinella spiralis]|uniref:hypothetical protein n=1 Tax=Trichinella spiralis TaxID=6334 RepID=UPI0001EFE61C